MWTEPKPEAAKQLVLSEIYIFVMNIQFWLECTFKYLNRDIQQMLDRELSNVCTSIF